VCVLARTIQFSKNRPLVRPWRPTDVFGVSKEVREASLQRFNQWSTSNLWQTPLRTLSNGRFLGKSQVLDPVSCKTKQGTSKTIALMDGIVMQQGPNYILSKRIQHWRAMLATSNGALVSTNVAPASATESVTSNPILAAGYGGAAFFPPLEIFAPETTKSLMTLLLIHDLHQGPLTGLAHPLDIFVVNSCHGGFWRIAFLPRSVNEVAAALFWIYKYKLNYITAAGVTYAAAKQISSRL